MLLKETPAKLCFVWTIALQIACGRNFASKQLHRLEPHDMHPCFWDSFDTRIFKELSKKSLRIWVCLGCTEFQRYAHTVRGQVYLYIVRKYRHCPMPIISHALIRSPLFARMACIVRLLIVVFFFRWILFYSSWHFESAQQAQDVCAHASEQSFTLNVCAGIIGNMLIGPNLLLQHFVDSTYYTFLERVLLDLMFDAPAPIRRNIWFQHDGHYQDYAGIPR